MFSPSFVSSAPRPSRESTSAAAGASSGASWGMNFFTARFTNFRCVAWWLRNVLLERARRTERASGIWRRLRFPGPARDRGHELVESLRRKVERLPLLRALVRGHQDLHDVDPVVPREQPPLL